MQDSRRRLPHRYPQDKWLSLTWHLHGSLPHALYPPAHKLSGGKAFAWMDRYFEAYIENNPVKAGLVARAEDYRWCS